MIANSLVCYGANNSMVDMIIELKEINIDVTVLLPGYGEIAAVLQDKKIKFYVLPYEYSTSVSISLSGKCQKIFNNLLLLKDAKRIVKEQEIEIIHTNASNVDFGALLALMCHIPHVWHIRELLKEDYNLKYDFPAVQAVLMHHADCRISISKYVRQKRVYGNNVCTIYNGLEISKYRIHKTKLFSSKTNYILYCGQISKEKGVMDAVKAIRKLVKLGYYNFKLDIVGESNAYSSRILDYINMHGLDEYVMFHGHQKNMKPFRERADIAIMCSRSEALGRVTIESMLGECLVIGANRGGTLELIRDGVTGYLYEAGNTNELVQKILLVYRDTENSQKIVKAAQAFAVKNFDNRKYAEKVRRVYISCLERRSIDTYD